MSLLGKSVERVEDNKLLVGRARFVDDIVLPSMLHAAFVRSPHGHAATRGINSRAALACQGVAAVLGFAEIAPHIATNRLPYALPSPVFRHDAKRQVLAEHEVCHVGEPVALVIASDRYLAEDAAAMVEVDYEPLPAVSDCHSALAADAPPVSRGLKDNLVAEFIMRYGDIDMAFATCSRRFRDRFWQHRGGGHSIECRGTVAAYDPDANELTLWTSTQSPHVVRRGVADVLGCDEGLIRVVAPDIGGAFGPKLMAYPEDAAVAIAARMLRRPIKWIEDRREHFVSTVQERDQYWDVEIAVDAQGLILGVRGSMIHDHGAYTARGTTVPYGAAQALTLAYEVPAYSLDVKLALTNKVPVSPIRGAGQPQGVFVMERMLDRVARELRIDRSDVRRRNLVPASRMPREKPLQTRGGVKVVLDSGDFQGCQDDALRHAGWDDFTRRRTEAKRSGRYIGIGLANYVEATGRGPFEPVTVRITGSGAVHVSTSAVAMGQGTKTMIAQIVADQLGIPIGAIRVTTGDTASFGFGFGGFNSRQAVTAGSSAHQAAIAVREKILAIASHMLEAPKSDLEIVAERVQVKGVPRLAVSLRDVAREVGGTPGHILPPGMTPGLEATEQFVVNEMAYANGTMVAEVEVDPETGRVSLTRIVFAHDCGRILHPAIVEGQLLGGIVHGIGNALYEHMRFDESCQPLTTNFGEYLLVSATETPRIELICRESRSPLNPLGVKGVGESGVIPTAAAIVSAIEDALSDFNVRITQAPISPPEILALIKGASVPA